MRASRFLSVLLSPFCSFSFRSLLSPGQYKRSRIELQYVRLHTSYSVLKPRYFNPTYKQVICTFSSALHVPNDFSSRHTYTNTHKACAFMHKQSWSTESAPLQCYLTGFSYQPALYRIKGTFTKFSLNRCLHCVVMMLILWKERYDSLVCYLVFVLAVSISAACVMEQSRWSHQTTAATVEGPENM